MYCIHFQAIYTSGIILFSDILTLCHYWVSFSIVLFLLRGSISLLITTHKPLPISHACRLGGPRPCFLHCACFQVRVCLPRAHVLFCSILSGSPVACHWAYRKKAAAAVLGFGSPAAFPTFSAPVSFPQPPSCLPADLFYVISTLLPPLSTF